MRGPGPRREAGLGGRIAAPPYDPVWVPGAAQSASSRRRASRQRAYASE